eukprot:gene2549-3155_t
MAQQLYLQPINPATTRPITDLKIDTKVTLQQKFDQCYLFKEHWKNFPLTEKKIIMTKFRDLLVENLEKLSEDLTEETGKPLTQAINEVKAVVDRVNFFIHNIEEVLAEKVVRTTDKFKESLVYEPLGVVAHISAWNYPFFIGLNAIIPALLSGNTVLYKPSEYASITGLNIMSLLYEAGLPEEALQIVLGKAVISQSLLALPLDGVFFTGSYNTGKSISETLAGRMVKLQLELGGKDAVYVHESADLFKAVPSIADGAMYNTGQSCCSVERIYVDKKIYNRFVNELVSATKQFHYSYDPFQPTTYFGPLTRGVPQISYIKGLIENALRNGAILELGGNVMSGSPGYFFAPTILSNVHHGMTIQKEEIFGPVVTVQSVSGPEEAVALMNDTRFGLTGSVYSEDVNVANYVLNKSNTGTVYWNSCDRVSPYLPWSGRLGSGIGSTLGMEGMYTFVRPKAKHYISPSPNYFGESFNSTIVPQTIPSLQQLLDEKAEQLKDAYDTDIANPLSKYAMAEYGDEPEEAFFAPGESVDESVDDEFLNNIDVNEMLEDIDQDDESTESK